MNTLFKSWNSLTSEMATNYLKTHGHPSETSKRLLVQILSKLSQGKTISILDLGCGNGHLFEYFRDQNLPCTYTGVDCSDPLLDAAQRAVGTDPRATFVNDDVHQLKKVQGPFDIALYSHVIEMLSSPEMSLLSARKLAQTIVIRFFEPPQSEVDVVEVREMDVGEGRKVPYIRRQMSRDYYRLILGKLGCRRVSVHRDSASRDEVHVLACPPA